MQNVIIMNAHRIANKQYQNNFRLQLKEFDIAYMHKEIMSKRAVEMCDVFIVTDEHNFKIMKCRVPNMPDEQVLPLSYLEQTLKLISDWQDQ